MYTQNDSLGRVFRSMFRPKDGRQTDIALLDWNTHAARRLTIEQQAGYSWKVVAWSSDDNG